MAAKSKSNGLNGIHTAGIFSDMTVDGPEIGTLVVIVDRAKNLPNRKTIGKQDPYCAARLGKEAKKTETDRRGGQTPRWDQELRYTVHDSPDYYQLKVSVFNDDKKTDLIGETWVDLKAVVIPGGGQNDLWHNLSCKGKYAGEIRIEITYYDTRPKQERPEKVKQSSSNSVVEDGSRDSLKGPRQPKAAVKRRPLPSDPITGAPAPLTILPDHVQTPPRGYPPSPTAVSEHSQTPSRGYSNPPAPILEHVQTPPRGHQSPEHLQTTPREISRGYQNAPSAIPEHVHTPQRGHTTQGSSYMPNQSPLQSVEYNTPPAHFSPSSYEDRSLTNGYGTSPGVAATPMSQSIPNDRYETYDPMARNDYHSGNNSNQRYREEEESIDPRDIYSHSPREMPYELPNSSDFGSPPSPGGPPPPPPAHRSRNGSTHVSSAPPLSSHGSYGFPLEKRPSNNYDTHHDIHRHSVTEYSQPQSNSYQAYSPERKQTQDQHRDSPNGHSQETPPRHHSYDDRYHGDYGSMQPTVEDAPPSPGGSYSRASGARASQFDSQYDGRYDKVPSPAPLNLSGRGSAVSGRSGVSTAPSHHHSSGSISYKPANSQTSYRDYSQTDASLSSRNSYNAMPQYDSQRQIEDRMVLASDYHRPRGQSANNSSIPAVPATLVAGMDPSIAQEISDRIYDEKRASASQASNSTRGRYQNPSQYQQPRPAMKQIGYYESETPFVPAAATYDDRQSRYSTATAQASKPRGVSPDPRVARKSVSPHPSPGAPDDQRRLSGIPFGPDSYNALNPTISGSTSNPTLSAAYDTTAPDPDAKIITHDGREIDPSDHIPESNYAPLLEQKGPKYASQQPDRNYRPAPQPIAATGRRQLQLKQRPQSEIRFSGGIPDSPPTNRNRLQKKSARMSAQPAPHSSPLIPITPYQDNNYSPRNTHSRSNTGEYSEKYAPNYGGSPGYRSSGPPPIPAKVPMNGGQNPPGGDAWALLEEMKNIDLGQGRARRRGY